MVQVRLGCEALVQRALLLDPDPHLMRQVVSNLSAARLQSRRRVDEV